MEKLEEEFIKTAGTVSKDVIEDIMRPTSKSVGNNIGLLVDGVMGWLGFWGEKQKIKREIYLDEYKKQITEEILKISDKNIVEPPISIVGPAIEASKYYIETNECRKMFAKLISSSCDSSLLDLIHPAYIEIIKQLTPLDAKYLWIFKRNSTYPAVEIQEIHIDGKVTPFPNLLFDFKELNDYFDQKEEMLLTKTVDNLIRLGIIKLNKDVIELNYDYDRFKTHWFYLVIKPVIEDSSRIRMLKYRIELTEFGKDFIHCCVPDDCMN